MNSQFIKGVKEMKNIKPIVFSSLIVGALSVAQTDAFAHGVAHGGHEAAPAPAEGVNKQSDVNSHGAGDTAFQGVNRPDPKTPEAPVPYEGGNKPGNVDSHGAVDTSNKGINKQQDVPGAKGLAPKGPEAIKVD